MSDTVYKEELFNALCNNSPTGVYIVQDGRFQFVNPQYRRMTGYSEEELLKMDSLMLVHTEDVGTVRGNAVKMLKGCRTEPYEFRFVRKNGEVRWVIETVTSIQFRGKRAALGNFMDVSECKWAEIALRESEGRYRTIFENTGTAMVIIKEDTTIFLINGKFEKILDYSMDEVEGKKSWTEFGMSPN
ncbi:MAG: PAS domain-containing protein [Bacillota bacterium]